MHEQKFHRSNGEEHALKVTVGEKWRKKSFRGNFRGKGRGRGLVLSIQALECHTCHELEPFLKANYTKLEKLEDVLLLYDDFSIKTRFKIRSFKPI